MQSMNTVNIFRSFAKIAATKIARLAPAPEVQDKVDTHFSSADPKKWKVFRKSLRNKSFVTAVRHDERADARLKRFTERVGRHVASKDPGVPVMGGSGKKYKVKFHAEDSSYSCSCPHWTYKLAPSTQGGDCRHIEQVKGSMKKQAGEIVVPPAVLRLLSAGYVNHKRENALDDAFLARLAQRSYKETVPSELRPRILPRMGV